MNQINAPVSASSVGWTAPSFVVLQDGQFANHTNADTVGQGLVVNMGTFPTASAGTVTFNVATVWTETGTGTVTANAWISRDGTTKAGSAIVLTLPKAPYSSGTTANRITSTALNGTLTGAQAAAGCYLIIEMTGTGGLSIDYLTVEAVWSGVTPLAFIDDNRREQSFMV